MLPLLNSIWSATLLDCLCNISNPLSISNTLIRNAFSAVVIGELYRSKKNKPMALLQHAAP